MSPPPFHSRALGGFWKIVILLTNTSPTLPYQQVTEFLDSGNESSAIRHTQVILSNSTSTSNSTLPLTAPAKGFNKTATVAEATTASISILASHHVPEPGYNGQFNGSGNWTHNPVSGSSGIFERGNGPPASVANGSWDTGYYGPTGNGPPSGPGPGDTRPPGSIGSEDSGPTGSVPPESSGPAVSGPPSDPGENGPPGSPGPKHIGPPGNGSPTDPADNGPPGNSGTGHNGLPICGPPSGPENSGPPGSCGPPGSGPPTDPGDSEPPGSSGPEQSGPPGSGPPTGPGDSGPPGSPGPEHSGPPGSGTPTGPGDSEPPGSSGPEQSGPSGSGPPIGPADSGPPGSSGPEQSGPPGSGLPSDPGDSEPPGSSRPEQSGPPGSGPPTGPADSGPPGSSGPEQSGPPGSGPPSDPGDSEPPGSSGPEHSGPPGSGPPSDPGDSEPPESSGPEQSGPPGSGPPTGPVDSGPPGSLGPGHSGPPGTGPPTGPADSGSAGSSRPGHSGPPDSGPPSGPGDSEPPGSSRPGDSGPPGSGPPSVPGDSGPPGSSGVEDSGPPGSGPASGSSPGDSGLPASTEPGDNYGPPGIETSGGSGPPGYHGTDQGSQPASGLLSKLDIVRLNLTNLTVCGNQTASNREAGAKQLFGHLEIDWCQDISQILNHATASVCGTKHLCNSYPDSKKDCDFKCYQCQCDTACLTYGDCCVDMSVGVSKSPANTSCVEAKWREFDRNPRARMVARCVTNLRENTELVQKCEHPDIFIQEEATPVSDETSGISYQNAFCALCNGVETYLPWNHRVTCQYAHKLYRATTDEELWAEVVSNDSSCDINTFPPGGIPVEYRCYPPGIRRCNVTGKWEGPNYDLLETLCESYEHPVEYNSLRYRNLFCAICNGINVYIWGDPCDARTEVLPYPLSVLLDFNPKREAVEFPASSAVGHYCREGEILDPFSKNCVRLRCQENEVLRAGLCQPMLSTPQGLGFSVTFLLELSVGEIKLSHDLHGNEIFGQLEHMLFNNFEGILIHKLKLRFFTSNSSKLIDSDRILVSVKVVITSEMTFTEIDAMLDKVESMNFTFLGTDQKEVVFRSTVVHCPPIGAQLSDNVTDVETHSDILAWGMVRGCALFKGDCLGNIRFIRAGNPLACPHVEYNLTSTSFSFNPDSGEIAFAGNYLELDNSGLFLCGEMMRMCSDVVQHLSSVFNNMSTVGAVDTFISTVQDVVLSWVSLICLSLSLLGLFLTFVIYCCLSKLRNLPGKITMLLVLHLFAALLLFVIGSNRQDELLCEVLAAGIHYFWMTVFGWMMIAAYHMYTVFANLKAITTACSAESNRKIVLYSVICHLGSMVVIGGCITYNFVQSQHSGYGGSVCFISEPLSIGVFFAGPLGTMLVFNIVCFILTVLAIRSVPDMSTASNSRNRHYVFVYIKIAVLFGFTWVFGLLMPLVESVVIQYVFVLLTGSQGVFIFIAYCLTGRAGKMLKEKISQQDSVFLKKTSQTSLSRDRKYEVRAKETRRLSSESVKP